MKKLPEDIRAMYTDAYRLHETFHGMENNLQNWVDVAKASDQVCNKHGNHPLIIALAVAVSDQLEREVNGA